MVLVTGGTGFIGAYILKELAEKGIETRAIRRSAKLPAFISADVFDKVEWVEGDILDLSSLDSAMQGVDAVIHSAAIVSFHAADRANLYKTNIEGTANVVNQAIEHNVNRFIHVSSIAALGRKEDGRIVTEDQKWEESRINTHYAISKYHGEMEVWRGIGEGLTGVIVNPSTVLGYGDWNSSSCAIFKNAYRQFPWYTNGTNGFVDVEDVAKAIVLLLETDISGERYILNGDNWSFRKLIDTMADNFQRKRPTLLATPFLGSIAWRIEKLKSIFSGSKPLLTRESARVAHSKTIFNNSKILAALPGFSFTPLDRTIQDACKHYILNLS